MDGAIEHKTFAPGYAEFGAEAEDELVTVAIAVPIDAGTDAAVSDAALELTGLSRDLFDHPDDPDAATAVTDAADCPRGARGAAAARRPAERRFSRGDRCGRQLGAAVRRGAGVAGRAGRSAAGCGGEGRRPRSARRVGAAGDSSMPRPRMGPRCWAMPRRWRRSLPGRTSARRRVRRSRRCERRRISATSRLRPRRRCCCCRPRRPRGPTSRGPGRPRP